MLTMVIADDEPIERKALQLLVKKNFPDIEVVALAGNGGELITAVKKHNPDLAIVDITMPGLSGLEGIEVLRQQKAKTRFVINTAYSEFEFAQKALSLKVDAYILKAQKQETTIETLQSVCSSIWENHENMLSQQQMHETINRIEPVIESQIMYSIFLDAPSISEFELYAEHHGGSFEQGTIVSMIPVAGGQIKMNQNDPAGIRKMLCRELDNRCSCLLNVGSNNICLFIFGREMVSPEWKLWISDLVSLLLEALQEEFELVLKAGVGSRYAEFEDMFGAYKESLRAFRSARGQAVVFYDEIGENRQEQSSRLPNSGETACETDNAYVNYAVRYINKTYFNPISLESVAEEIGVSSYYLSRLFKQETGHNFVEYLTRVRMEKAVELVKNTKLSAREIAAKVGYYNSAYFSRIFKKYTDKTVSELREELRRNKFEEERF